MFALDLTERENVSMHRYLTGVLGEEGDIVENDMRLRKERIHSSQMNPNEPGASCPPDVFLKRHNR